MPPDSASPPAQVQIVDAALARAAGRAALAVAVGVLIDEHGNFLMTSRPPGKVYAGYWEFPGGKVEPGETAEQALGRELHEEIGVTISAPSAWYEAVVDYPHALVRLSFFVVRRWQGRLVMHEGQEARWCRLSEVPQPVLPGSVPVLARIATMFET